MPVYTWLMARSSDEKPEEPGISLEGWKLSFPSRPHIKAMEFAENEGNLSLTGNPSESWTPGESIAIERRFDIDHAQFLKQTGLPDKTTIKLGIKWRVESRSAAGFEGRLITLNSDSGKTLETVSTTMDGARLGGTVLVSTPITLHSIPEGSPAQALAAKESGRILWRGLDRSSGEDPLRIALEGEGSRFPIRCVNMINDKYSYFVEWSHIPSGSIDTPTMMEFLKRDPRTVFRVVVNTATDLGKTLIGNVLVNTATDQDKTLIVNHEKNVEWARKCWAHEIGGSIAQKLFHLCRNLDENATQTFRSQEPLKQNYNYSGAVNMGGVLAGFIEVMSPRTMTGNANYAGLKETAEYYFTNPEIFVKAWQAKIQNGAGR